MQAAKPFNPCLDVPEDEQISAKIWELLRRNKYFRATVHRLGELDSKERSDWTTHGKYHGVAWQKSCRLVKRVQAGHPFAGLALQWLVPEPFFQVRRVTWPLGKHWRKRSAVSLRSIQVGEGSTANMRDTKHWCWWKNFRQANREDSRPRRSPTDDGRLITRGPQVRLTISRFRHLSDKVNPILEWKRFPWPFTVEHSWNDAPPEFRRQLQFIWRFQYDCRANNPITQNRSDSPSPHETDFFQRWNLTHFRASGRGANLKELRAVLDFKKLGSGYRVFAIPKTILTKASADAMGKWLADELKKGSQLLGDLLSERLLNEGELFGTTNEWTDWLSHQAGQSAGVARDTHFYRRCRYMTSLVDLIFPRFEINKLLAPPKHRARGKKYVRK